MDERVYEVLVCPTCFTQVDIDSEGDHVRRCEDCPKDEYGLVRTTTIRFRCARDSVLKQADPHRSLVERTVYFGCVGDAGHYYFERGRDGHPMRLRHVKGESHAAMCERLTPWGTNVDGGLFPRNARPGIGEAHVFHRDGWTALAFEDNSVDSRPGSWSVYCIPAVLDGPEALAIAREAFPPIFARYSRPGRRDTPPFEVKVVTG